MVKKFLDLSRFRIFRNRKTRAAIRARAQAPRYSARWYEALEERCLLSTVTFGVVGDYGDNSTAEANVAALVANLNPDYMVTAGDNRYGSRTYEQTVGNHFGQYLPAASGGTSATNRFFPSTGNHDYDDGGGINQYLSFFDLPGAGTTSTNTSGTERYYDVVIGDVHLFSIDSSRNTGANGSQRQWLQTTMEASTAAWQVVVTHHAPYSSSSNHGSQRFMQWDYADWGADAVIAGHDHIYERINRDGIKYFVNGLGGRSFYGIGSPINGSQFRYNSQYGAMKVTASETEMTFEFFNINGTLIDSDTISQAPQLPEVSIVATDPNAAEPANNGAFTVTRTGDTTNALTVNYSIAGTATNGNDYNSLSGSVTIAAGDTSTVINVGTIDDNIIEGDETVLLLLDSNPTYIVGASSNATVTIADDDTAALPTVSIVATDPDASESGDPGQFTVTRTGDTSSDLTVNYFMRGTADNGVDYTALTKSVTILAGETSAVINVDPIDDTLIEGNEKVIVKLALDPAYDVGAARTAKVTIADDDTGALPTVSIVATDPDASESGDPGQFTVTRTGDTSTDLTVNYFIRGSAENGVDYATLTKSVTILAGATSAAITIDSIDDGLVEGNEKVVVKLALNPVYTIGAARKAKVTIADNDNTGGPGPVVITSGLDDRFFINDQGSFDLFIGNDAIGDPTASTPLVVDISIGGNADTFLTGLVSETFQLQAQQDKTIHVTVDNLLNQIINIDQDRLYGINIGITGWDLGAPDTLLLDDNVFVYRFLDAADDKHTDGVVEFADTANDGVGGSQRLRAIDLRVDPSAIPTFVAADSTHFGFDDAQGQFIFDPTATANNLMSTLSVVSPDNNTAGTLDVLGDATHQEIFVDRAEFLRVLEGLADQSISGASSAERALIDTPAEREAIFR